MYFLFWKIYVNLIDEKCLVCAHFQINVLAAIPSLPKSTENLLCVSPIVLPILLTCRTLNSGAE